MRLGKWDNFRTGTLLTSVSAALQKTAIDNIIEDENNINFLIILFL